MRLRSFQILLLLASLAAAGACPCSGGAGVPSSNENGGSGPEEGLGVRVQIPDPEPVFGEAGALPTEEPDPLEPTNFAGFSSDESRFAYSAYSSGAGVHLFTVVDSATGRRITDLPLYDADMRRLARQILEEGGFSNVSADGSAILARGESLRMEAEPGNVRIQLVRGESVVSLSPPKTMAEVAERLRRPDVDLWGFSPRGTYLAVRVTDDQGSVLGKATTYQVLGLAEARGAAGPSAP